MRRSLVVVVVALVLGACSGERAPDPAPTRSSSAPPSPRASVTPSATPEPIRYVFPVDPPRASRAAYSAAHHDYPATDVFAPCGSRALAPVRGRVEEVSLRDRWDGATNRGADRGGLSVSIVGDDGVRYYGSHLASVRRDVRPGARVDAGDVLGRVGDTGSAAGTGCHLHVGISPDCGPDDWWVRRGVISPYRYLRSWEEGGQRSPVRAVRAWTRENGCPSAP